MTRLEKELTESQRNLDAALKANSTMVTAHTGCEDYHKDLMAQLNKAAEEENCLVSKTHFL